MSADSLTLTTTWGDRIDVPLARVLGVYMGMADHKESPESFAKRLKAPGSEDLLLARAKDGEVVAIGGVVEAAKENKLTFAYRGKSRTLALKQVEGLVLAARPAPKPPTEVRPTFTLSGGLVLSGRWVKIEGDKWQVETPWGQTVKLPAAEIRGVRFRGGQMAYLSDLEAEQGRGDPVLRPPVALSPGRRARRLAAEARRPAHREGARGPLADGPDLRPRPPVRHVRGAGRIRRLGRQEGPRRLPGLRRRQGALRQSRPPRRRPAGPPVPARLGGRTAPARRGLRARRGHRRSRDLGERPPLSSAPRQPRPATTSVAAAPLDRSPTTPSTSRP